MVEVEVGVGCRYVAPPALENVGTAFGEADIAHFRV